MAAGAAAAQDQAAVVTAGAAQAVPTDPVQARLQALEEEGLEIIERVSIEVTASESAARYLQTKKEKLGHLLDLGAH